MQTSVMQRHTATMRPSLRSPAPTGLGRASMLLARPSTQRCRPVRFKEGEREGDSSGPTTQQAERVRDNLSDSARDGVKSLKEEVKYVTQEAVAPHDQWYDENAPMFNQLIPVFSRRREAFVGRIAIVGYFAACLWEAVYPDHPGILQQVAGFTGFSTQTALALIVSAIAFSTLGGLLPFSPTFSKRNVQDVARRPQGPPNTWVSPLDFKSFLGISDWGFTKRNEIFNGRLAMLGFLAAVVQEVRMGGKGPLAQIAMYMNVEATDTFYSSMMTGFGAFTLFAIVLGYVRGNNGDLSRNPEKEMF